VAIQTYYDDLAKQVLRECRPTVMDAQSRTH
jgi:hypothetical protein